MKKPGKRRTGGSLLVAASLGAVVAFGSGFIVAGGAWYLPSLAATIVDRSRAGSMARAMVLFGLAATIPDIARLWQLGGDFDSGLRMAADPMAVGRAWTSQGAAWLLAEALPVVLAIRAEIGARRRLDELEARRRALEEEWAPETQVSEG